MGRNTWNFVRSAGSWPYGDKQVVVLSSGKVEIPPDLTKAVYSTSETPEAIVRRLAKFRFQAARQAPKTDLERTQTDQQDSEHQTVPAA